MYRWLIERFLCFCVFAVSLSLSLSLWNFENCLSVITDCINNWLSAFYTKCACPLSSISLVEKKKFKSFSLSLSRTFEILKHSFLLSLSSHLSFPPASWWNPHGSSLLYTSSTRFSVSQADFFVKKKRVESITKIKISVPKKYIGHDFSWFLDPPKSQIITDCFLIFLFFFFDFSLSNVPSYFTVTGRIVSPYVGSTDRNLTSFPSNTLHNVVFPLPCGCV